MATLRPPLPPKLALVRSNLLRDVYTPVSAYASTFEELVPNTAPQNAIIIHNLTWPCEI